MAGMNLQHRAKTAYEEGSYLLGGAVGGSVIAASNSLKSVKLYSLDALEFVGELKGHSDPITDLAFNRADPNVLVTFGGEGYVNLWDTRSGKPTALNLPLNNPYSLCSGDLSCDGKYLAVGDQYDISIYDSRNLSQALHNLEGFHSDDITRVRFHGSRPNVVCTGSEDGLLIASDATAPNEDDAIIWIFNVENAVNQISYYENKVIAITSIDSVVVGCLDSGDNVGTYERPEEHLYAVASIDNMMLWGVNGEGFESRVGEIRCAQIGISENPEGWPSLTGGHEDVVRFAYTHPTNPNVLYTGGEDGFLASWGAAQRDGLPTESRVGASKDMLSEFGELPSAPPPAPPAVEEDEEDVICAGPGVVKVTPLAAHKARKTSAKARKGPY